MRTQAKVFIAIFILTCITLVFINQKRVTSKINNLKQKGIVRVGLVTGCNLLPKQGNSLNVKYIFLNKGQDYKSESLIMGIHYNNFIEKFIGKYFPVIYLSNDPSNNELLITPDRFKRYGIPFPDSLKWVAEYWSHDYKRFD